ncbi:uncharacterized protein LOC124165216 [Ischnura elegans]|uniref:uncharacterized protein LOC124165216 n=1 Tax=Ischnura elegans TaxID=197161 RepID=UPI001ED88EA9|nr:uncharacterized protein LOC124165216 [Ischnura elegans]XP_046398453.1 uncharacterized protein LOC124165216 [Ischnura elegans]
MEGKCLSVIGEEAALGLPNVPKIGHGNMTAPMTLAREVPVTQDEDVDAGPSSSMAGLSSSMAGPSNVVVPGEHLEIIVEDLFTPDTQEAPRRKAEGELERATALIVEAVKKNAVIVYISATRHILS